LLNAPQAAGLGHSSPSLVQIASESKQMEETRV